MAAPTITFVFCIESGQLEGIGIRAIESLRRWGGSLANSPVIAVQPRFGPPLDRATLWRFASLNVSYLNVRPERRYQWSHFLNKPKALLAAEETAGTELIVWLDDDILVVGEPSDYLLSPEHDFAATAPDKGVGTSGPGDPNEAYWAQAAEILGIDINKLEYIQTTKGDQRIRLYWNAGIFVYRASTQFAHIYTEACVRLFDARLAHRKSGLFFNEQVALSLTSATLRWRYLHCSHNFGMATWSGESYPIEELLAARVLHYHNWMTANNQLRFPGIIEAAHPEVAQFLRREGPIRQGSASWKWLSRSALRVVRALEAQKYLRQSRPL
jgi:hypothetical protein